MFIEGIKNRVIKLSNILIADSRVIAEKKDKSILLTTVIDTAQTVFNEKNGSTLIWRVWPSTSKALSELKDKLSKESNLILILKNIIEFFRANNKWENKQPNVLLMQELIKDFNLDKKYLENMQILEGICEELLINLQNKVDQLQQAETQEAQYKKKEEAMRNATKTDIDTVIPLGKKAAILAIFEPKEIEYKPEEANPSKDENYLSNKKALSLLFQPAQITGKPIKLPIKNNSDLSEEERFLEKKLRFQLSFKEANDRMNGKQKEKKDLTIAQIHTAQTREPGKKRV